MPSARRRHLVALVLAALVGLLVSVAPGRAVAGAQECDELGLPLGCTASTTTSTTEAPAETTTTVDDETTTSSAPARTTTTTEDQTTTTERPVVDSTTTTLDVTTSINVLVPGDGTEGAESTTTTTQQTETRISGGGTSDGTLITLIVGGLLALALFVSVLTWRYWAATRPPLESTVGSKHG